IAEYLNVAPPPPPSNTSTITTSSIASTEESSRRASWSTGAGGIGLPAASATVDGSVPTTLFGNNYIAGRNGGTSVGQLTDIVTIIINIDDNESSTGRDDTVVVGGSSGTSGGGSNSMMGVLCDLSTHDDVNCSAASASSNNRDNSNCDSNNANSTDNNESNSDSHLISKQITDV
uniref:Uncharacterized protein n=1 Tax=Anopheles maculatus TaxID=74869 RepID=A0A182SLQ8_9DIPT